MYISKKMRENLDKMNKSLMKNGGIEMKDDKSITRIWKSLSNILSKLPFKKVLVRYNSKDDFSKGENKCFDLLFSLPKSLELSVTRYIQQENIKDKGYLYIMLQHKGKVLSFGQILPNELIKNVENCIENTSK